MKAVLKDFRATTVTSVPSDLPVMSVMNVHFVLLAQIVAYVLIDSLEMDACSVLSVFKESTAANAVLATVGLIVLRRAVMAFKPHQKNAMMA